MLTVITDLSTITGIGSVFSCGNPIPEPDDDDDPSAVAGGVLYSESSYSNSNGASWDPLPIKHGCCEQVHVMAISFSNFFFYLSYLDTDSSYSFLHFLSFIPAKRPDQTISLDSRQCDVGTTLGRNY